VNSSRKEEVLSGTRPNSASTPQQFEWVNYKDEASKKRARSHVARRTRKQKEDEEKHQWEKRKAAKLATKVSEKSPAPSVIRQSNYQSALTPPDSERNDSYDVVFALQELRTSLLIRRTLGSTKADPFGVFPVVLDAKSYALLDHCKW
jgi:hypothetical protein